MKASLTKLSSRLQHKHAGAYSRTEVRPAIILDKQNADIVEPSWTTDPQLS